MMYVLERVPYWRGLGIEAETLKSRLALFYNTCIIFAWLLFLTSVYIIIQTCQQLFTESTNTPHQSQLT